MQGHVRRIPLPGLRRHDADGISDAARDFIDRHGLDAGRILEIADGYAPEEDTDFNLAPARDIKRALVGRNLACAMYAEPAFD